MRKANFELMRIFAAILILFFHCANAIGITEQIGIKRIFLVLIGSWGILGVDLFLLLSIYFIRNRVVSKKKIKNIVNIVLFYAILVCSGGGILQRDIRRDGNSYCISELSLSGNDAALIYKYVLVCFSDIIFICNDAFLFLIREQAKTNRVYYGILIFLLLCANAIMNVNILSDFLFVSLVYFVAIEIFEKENNFFERNYKVGSVLGTGVLVVSRFLLPMLDNNIFISYFIANTSRYSLIMLMNSIFIFYWFKNVEVKEYKIIKYLAGISLPLYLLHDNKLFSLRYIAVEFLEKYIDWGNINAKKMIVVYLCLCGGFILMTCMIEYGRRMLEKLVQKM